MPDPCDPFAGDADLDQLRGHGLRRRDRGGQLAVPAAEPREIGGPAREVERRDGGGLGERRFEGSAVAGRIDEIDVHHVRGERRQRRADLRRDIPVPRKRNDTSPLKRGPDGEPGRERPAHHQARPDPGGQMLQHPARPHLGPAPGVAVHHDRDVHRRHTRLPCRTCR